MESRFPFFDPNPAFQPNSHYLNDIKKFDILSQSNQLLLFLIHHGEARHRVWGAGG
jgi:hypothetical protein